MRSRSDNIRDFVGRFISPNMRGEFEKHTRAGDAARDGMLWAEAASHYARALEMQPNNAAILVQMGHMQKEAGDFSAAESSYQKALEVNPDDHDLLVQLGHLHKLTGDGHSAQVYYRRAIDLGSTDVNARYYLDQSAAAVPERIAFSAAAGHGLQLAKPQAAGSAVSLVPAVYLDITDLIAYFFSNRFPTGIQRVEIELVLSSFAWDAGFPIVPCTFVADLQAWVELEPGPLETLFALATNTAHPTGDAWAAMILDLRSTLNGSRPMFMSRGAVLINLAPWWSIDYYLFLRNIKTLYGIRYVPLIHDLIPLITPEYLPFDMRSDCATWLSSALMHADAIAVNSECTRRDVMKAAQAIMLDIAPPIVMPLNAEFGGRKAALTPPEMRRLLEQLDLLDTDFILFVATLEARKNHLILFQAWAKLIEWEGADAVPALVCVGRRHWGFEQAESFLKAHPELSAKVRLVSGVSDIGLSSLYNNCLFTVYTSTYEGWGLPITESLSYGKVCLAFDHSSLPEAGEDFAEYCATDSTVSLANTAWRLISDREYRSSREKRIKDCYRPRHWQGVLQGMVTGVVSQLQTPLPSGAVVATIRAGVLYEMRLDRALRQATRETGAAEMLRLGTGWHRAEQWGTWTASLTATVGFRLAESPTPRADILVYLELGRPFEPLDVTVKLGPRLLVKIRLADKQQLRLLVPASTFEATKKPDGIYIIALTVDTLTAVNRFNTGDDRHVGLGLKSFMVVEKADIDSRLKMIDRCMSSRRD